MRLTILLSTLASTAFAARPFLNEPDTGTDDVLGDLPAGTLPNLTNVVGLPDFEWVARRYLPVRNYTYYRNGAAGEWSYRNNLEVFRRYRLRPRVLVDISDIESSLPYGSLSFYFMKCKPDNITFIGPRYWATISRPPFSSAHAQGVTTDTRTRSSTLSKVLLRAIFFIWYEKISARGSGLDINAFLAPSRPSTLPRQ